MLSNLLIFIKVVREVKNWPTYFLSKFGLIKSPVILVTSDRLVLIRPNQIDRWVYTENFVLDDYKLNQLRAEHFDYILDIGGNIGSFSLMASQKFPKALIHCYEPDPDSFSILEANIHLNQLASIQPFKSAVTGNGARKVDLFSNQNPAMRSLANKKGKRIKVESTSLKRALGKLSGHFLVKIDIEGGEHLLMTKQNMPLFRKIPFLVMEWHYLNKKLNLDSILRYLDQTGFQISVSGTMVYARHK